MSKRKGENLARTQDGSAYNKLQRPDNWPSEPARSTKDDLDETRDVGYTSDASSDLRASAHNTPGAINRRKNHQKSYRDYANSCLPMDENDVSGLEQGDDPSFAAMQYLKSVRAQANVLPEVHSAPPHYAQPEEDHRGYYEDGTYTGAPELGPEWPNDYEDEDWDEQYEDEGGESAGARPVTRVSPFEAYTNALLSRFRQLRQIIRDIKASPNSQAEPYIVPRLARLQVKDYDRWNETMATKPPRVSALAATSKSSLLSLLAVLKDRALVRKCTIQKTSSLWFLSVLASIDEQTVDGDVMAELRHLAKKAIWLRIDFEPQFEEAAAVMGAEFEDELQSENGATPTNVAMEPGPIDEKDMRAPNGGADATKAPDETTKATLDMVVAIVGEVFGQRDLLESRNVIEWPVNESEDAVVDEANG